MSYLMASIPTADALSQTLLIALQVVQVIFLWIHDWIPLGRLNDVVAVRSQGTVQRLVIMTLMQCVPYTIILIFTVRYLGDAFPRWLDSALWISYSLLLLGQIRAWWIPYLFQADPTRAARYEIMFGNTHSFLPTRNGLVPNTAHILLHACTTATLLVLLARAINI
jgi:hypothetical protein